MATAEAEDEASLSDHAYGDLMNLARSAREQFESVDIDTDAPTKDELVASLEEYDPEGSRAAGWSIEVDGTRQDVELLAVQTPDRQSGPSEPRDKTILYALTRAETTPERVQQISDALEEHTDFRLEEAGSSGDKYAIVLPVENQDIPEPEEAEDEDESDDDSDEDEASDEDDGGEDADESEAEDDESDSSDDSGPTREELEGMNKDEVYSLAVEADVDGRSDMSKDELVDALTG